MKYVILTMSLLATMHLQAADTLSSADPELAALANPAQTQPVATIATGNGTLLFDTYVAEPGLQAIDASAANNATVVAGLGDQLIVAAAATAKTVAATDTVVRNTLTGELGVLTGRLHIVTDNVALLKSLSERYQLQPLKSLRGGKIQLLQAPANADLSQLLQQIRQEQGVQAARLDVLENINTPQ